MTQKSVGSVRNKLETARETRHEKCETDLHHKYETSRKHHPGGIECGRCVIGQHTPLSQRTSALVGGV